MCYKKKKGDKRPPRKPRQGPYKKVNACTIKPNFDQIITVVLMLAIIILHSIFIVRPIVSINNPILYFLLALHYLLFLFLVIDYIIIANFDPVDRLIVDKNQLEYAKKNTKNNLKHCRICRSETYEKSYHCHRCNRCTEGFDHHCSFLNTCIGQRNYQIFMRIIFFFILFCLNVIGQSAWVFVRVMEVGQTSIGSLSRWGCIPLMCLGFGCMIPVVVLCVFHIYISCCVDLTTVEFIQTEETEKQNYSSSHGMIEDHNI